MKRAALYIRVSTEEQARHGLSLGEQRADLEQYAKEHNYTVVDIYADEGSSARKSTRCRKELQRLLDDVRAGKIDIILFKCLDRWFRSIRDYYAVQDVLDAHHVDWECTQERYNTTSTNGRLMLNIKLSVAQNESDQTSDRIKYIFEGKMQRKEALTRSAPYGYTIKDKHYVIVPERAKIAKEIFDRTIAGDTPRVITKDLNLRGVDISARTVRELIRKPAYTGVYRGIDGYYPPIVSKEEFERVQAILATNPRPVRKGHINLFTGLIICPSCGRRLIASLCLSYRSHSTERHVVYRCHNHYGNGRFAGEHRCAYGGAVGEISIERYLVTNLARLLRDYATKFRLENDAGNTDFEALKKAAQGRLKRAKDLYIDGMIERAEFDERAQKIRSEIAEYDLKLLHQKKMSPAVVDTLNHIDGFEERYAALDRKAKREFWHRLIERIELGERPKHRGQPYFDFRIFFV